jgi:DNA processing protein
MPDLVDVVALSLLPTWCWLTAGDLLRAGQSSAEVLRQLCGHHWRDRPDYIAELRAQATTAVRRGVERGLTPVAWDEAAYPIALTTIPDPPPVLWTRGDAGNAIALNAPAVAIVGSRAASPYALSVAEQLAHDLARVGLVVVSGLARGVDSAAHRGTLAAGGATVAVLGSGADVIYPPEHEALAREIAKDGIVISELVPGTPPLPRCFPLRNRIISGLSRAVVVIEAGERSGSLITARAALEQGRDVLAVPGNVLSGRNRGNHALLRDGAKIVESADDILEELGMLVRAPRGPVGDGLPFPAPPPDPVLASLTPGEPSDLDTIAERSGLTPAKLLPRLFELELRGSIARVGGGRFVRIDRTC